MNNTRIHDLPDEERPREKLLRLGPGALSGPELLAILLRTGVQGQSAIEIGRSLIQQAGSLAKLQSLDLTQLEQQPGLGPAKACQLAAAFELGARAAREKVEQVPLKHSQAIYDYFRHDLEHRKTECLVVASLTSRLVLHRATTISIGTADATPSMIRDVVRPALIDQTPAFVILHNHPSGNPQPSRADDAFTKKLVQAAELLHLRLIDHIVIGRPSDHHEPYYSYQDQNRLH